MAAADSHGQFLELEDAVRYMKIVENRHPASYSEFLGVMVDYKRGRIGVAEVASTVSALFRDSPNLIVSFNAFLPKRHRIRLSDEQAAGLEKPTSFVKAVMNTHPATYREFLRIIFDEYGRDGVGIAEVASRVGALFRDRPDLIAGFNAILPREHKIKVIGGLDEHELAARFVREVSLDDHDDDEIHDG
ncbi:paired amphipathic helix protein Sin3-like 4 [Aegilops tauschii subsp. strangulata]|uniref:paired amphipathic helix protein Sin3-like 4 n=1 Tax=Aegilops tauschii subsp. strangulata TaxID=200361 RepID=UPI00098AB1CC|nr:paired amphipathic helix protein Sin3-like 4 [Aegilops tauschii subsp. strangulata]